MKTLSTIFLSQSSINPGSDLDRYLATGVASIPSTSQSSINPGSDLDQPERGAGGDRHLHRRNPVSILAVI